jgi:hypothetical protein
MAAQAAIHANIREPNRSDNASQSHLVINFAKSSYEAGVDGRRPCGAWLRHDAAMTGSGSKNQRR